MEKNLLFAFLFFFFCSSFQASQAQGERYIEVYGTASQEIAPNEILYSLRINTEKLYDEYQYNYDYDQFDPVKSQEIQNKVELRISTAEKQLLEVLEKLGIDGANAQSNPFSLSSADAYNASGYLLTLKDFETLEALVKELKPYDLFQGWVTQLKNTEEEGLREELKLQALKNAQEKAQKMARALGGRLGPALQIREVRDASYVETDYNHLYYDNSDFYNDQGSSIPPGQRTIRLHAQIWVRFALE